jgi:hypothetical protein
MDRRLGSSGRVPALQVQSPKFKPQSHQKWRLGRRNYSGSGFQSIVVESVCEVERLNRSGQEAEGMTVLLASSFFPFIHPSPQPTFS